MTPTGILAAVADAYQRFVEYEDAGVVLEGGRCVVRFETRFVRDELFHFSFSADPRAGNDLRPMARVTATPAGLEFWTMFKGAPRPTDLSLAVAALSGISSGAAHGASSLLIKEVGGWLPTELMDAVLLPGRTVCGRSCLTIQGKHPRGLGFHSLLVEEGTFLIRGRIDSGVVEHYTEYESCRAR